MIQTEATSMCTLTFIPKSTSEFVLTSNRDEAPNRATLFPELYAEGDTTLLFPKDALAGGTWIGTSSRKRLVCLLNGGFVAHERAASYRMSRGIIVKELLSSEDARSKINGFDFSGIEPFTLVLVDWVTDLKIFELVWDGNTPHFSEKPLTPQIWSSSLLYTSKMKEMREQWFSEFLFEHINPSKEQLLRFHKTAGTGNPETDLVMDRGFIQTKSITQVSLRDSIIMRYEDLQQGKITHHTL